MKSSLEVQFAVRYNIFCMKYKKGKTYVGQDRFYRRR